MTDRKNTIEILDTTLRDGAQSEKLAFAVKDKINIIHALDRAGIAVIEAGNPGASPKDMELFVSLVLSVLASLVAYYICKWLYGKEER